jgi:hypothetical protein
VPNAETTQARRLKLEQEIAAFERWQREWDAGLELSGWTHIRFGFRSHLPCAQRPARGRASGPSSSRLRNRPLPRGE